MNPNPSYPTEKLNDDNEDRGLPSLSQFSLCWLDPEIYCQLQSESVSEPL